MKLIREGRFGPPKSFKTGAVVGTYPQPLLCLEYDHDGLSIIRDPVTMVTPEKLMIDLIDKIPPIGITGVDMTNLNKAVLSEIYVPRPDTQTFPKTVQVINALVKSCPFKTIVIDTVTGLSDCIYGHQSAVNASALADARKWAGNIGMKVKQVIDTTCQINANVVVIFHSDTEKNELTGEIRELPMVYSKLREFLGAMFSQFFYATPDFKVKTKAFQNVKGIGCRWPMNLPDTCGPLFNDIYGKEVDVLK